MTAMPQSFHVLDFDLAIARLGPAAEVPDTLFGSSGFLTISRTPDEVSIVCEESLARDFERVELEWRAIKLAGPFAFDQVGILSSVLEPLARANIGIFAISTFDTDYILVKAQNLGAAIDALEAHGHRRLP